ncbi:hypothetical protein M833_003755 [Salmonella enterica subsp. enterica serovar Typhimurium str. STm7]|nr:hypothetical protein M833_003755 [Salmonella enterica subsp. enterica serovar Typhimurium str. STm7]
MQGNPYGEPESTTLLTLLPVLFWPAFAGFFFGFCFSLAYLSFCPREVLVLLTYI